MISSIGSATDGAAVPIAVLGAAGRMGRAIVAVIAQTPGVRLAAAVEHPGNALLGQDAGAIAGAGTLGVPLAAALPEPARAQVWIDFSAPLATAANAESAAGAGVAFVTGTTGLDADARARLARAAERVPLVFAPNMSIGVNLLLRLVTEAARTLGPDYDIDIVETHHRWKRDAPSGTALRLAEAAAEGRGVPLDAVARYARHGEIGARPDGEIGLQTLRGGDVVGDHTVFFLGQGERIELTHRASSRETFARGAVRAAVWVRGRAPGMYDMRDVLGLR